MPANGRQQGGVCNLIKSTGSFYHHVLSFAPSNTVKFILKMREGERELELCFLLNNFQWRVIEVFQHHTTGFLIPAKMSAESFCFPEWSTLFLTDA